MAMIDEKATVLANERLHDSLYLMTLSSPKLASQMLPGQFVHMSIPDLHADILRRPFSIYDSNPDEGILEILYQVVGTGTERMTCWEKGSATDMIGPIGKRWTYPDEAERALLIGGGVGAAPLYMLAKEMTAKGIDVDAVLGAATEPMLVCKDRYGSLCGDSAHFTTDDGSFGTEGFATAKVQELLDRGIEYGYAAICGPEPLMRFASRMTMDAGIPTQVSLERRMACGIGACLSCTCDTDGGRKRVCIDGPVFDASEVVW